MIEMVAEGVVSDGGDDLTLFTRALAARMQRLSAPARRLFEFLIGCDGPVDEETVARSLELFESDEPLRTLRRERLIRVRKTGDLEKIDVYHPQMRAALGPAAAHVRPKRGRGQRMAAASPFTS